MWHKHLLFTCSPANFHSWFRPNSWRQIVHTHFFTLTLVVCKTKNLLVYLDSSQLNYCCAQFHFLYYKWPPHCTIIQYSAAFSLAGHAYSIVHLSVFLKHGNRAYYGLPAQAGHTFWMAAQSFSFVGNMVGRSVCENYFIERALLPYMNLSHK